MYKKKTNAIIKIANTKKRSVDIEVPTLKQKEKKFFNSVARNLGLRGR